MCNWKSSISIFQELSISINKTFILTRRLRTKMLFYGFWTVLWFFLISEHRKSQVVLTIVRQLVYTMFQSNNRTSFHLWPKNNLIKQQNVSKYYENDCLQNFIWFFMSLLITKLVKNNYVWDRIAFIFQKSS